MAPAPAPIYDDVAGGPAGGAAWWLDTADGLRIRIGCWRPDGAARGTVLLFPGRTEYVEKYGDTARDLVARGFAVLAIDWRGQGLAARLLADRRVGHVRNFTDYQKDIATAVAAAQDLDLPRPWHLLAHSMGGCIGLRAVMDGLPVRSCAFTGPMWGISIAPSLRPVAVIAAYAGSAVGYGGRLMPSTKPQNYVEIQDYADNMLTGDADMYRMMQEQLAAHPDLGLGGPSMRWMRGALRETALLARRPSPDLPCVTFLGTREQIVDGGAIRNRMAGWRNGALDVVEDAQHEVLMETPAIRAAVMDRLEELFAGNG